MTGGTTSDAVAYIVLDIAHDGTLDGSILRVISDERARVGHGAEVVEPR